ncbi:MAG: class I SAM-dependent methyltransferase, partial [Cyanobacteria bacterium P01_E01_bin.42]
MQSLPCKICGCTESRIVYSGPIRLGRFGNISQEPYDVRQCLSCQAIALPNIIEDTVTYYETSTYRTEVDISAEVDDYYRLHDGEQLKNLSMIGTGICRDKIVADIGCGAGSFLDAVKGYAREAIAIEPSSIFRESLQQKGYLTYPYVENALEQHEGQVEVAVSFSVIEHIETPLIFLQQIYRLLKPEGFLCLSTPNAKDILLEVLPQEYTQFFYRKVHFWYFTPFALTKLLELAGFSDIQIFPYQRFGLGNFLGWLRDKKPQGEL